SAGASYDPLSLNDTTFTIYATPTPGTTLTELETALAQEVAAVMSKGVTIEELNSAKSRKRASLTYYLDSLQGPAILFGRALGSGFSTEYVENRPARLEKLTIDDITHAAAAVFQSEDIPVTGILLPQEKPVPEGQP